MSRVTVVQMPRSGGASDAAIPSFNFLMILLTFAGAGLAIQFGIGGQKGLAFVFVLAGWVLSLCLHEFGHAFMAWKGGDHAIAGTGYLTLDPRLYIDPLTSIVLPVLFTILGGIGFPGGAVFVNRDLLRSSGWQSAVSLAGPAMNLVFLVFLVLLYRLASADADTIRAVLAVSALYQATAIVLNLLPIPGLDGYGIIRPWIPDGARAAGDQIGRYSGLVITGLFLLSGAFTRAIFGAGLTITANFGFAPQDVVAGYRLMRLW
ncbi:site-2 protease family protein [Methylobacterium haplocladii]|nr:site-2 protease family protein [Methylobacterium haplocladii]GJD83161.1 hypothetical protein HPGCJGGD_1024 [Methylobacterium haplocladii]GLS59101.1 site-2 protease family protein [Methylobacterium haplocladii]